MLRILSPLLLALVAAPAAAQSVIDDFETYAIGTSFAENTGSVSIDDTTVTGTGQGPGLVTDGCTYSAFGGEIQWNGDGYFGLGSRSILSNFTNTITLEYDSAVTDIDLELKAFSGSPDTATITGLLGGSVVFTSAPIAIAGPTPVPYNSSGVAVDELQITGTNAWSPILDNHAYRGGPQLAINGLCPGPATVVVTGATPFATIAFASSSALGSFTIPSGACAGTTLGLASPTLLGFATADGTGTVNLAVTLPAGFCGDFLQAVDLGTCTPSNTTPF